MRKPSAAFALLVALLATAGSTDDAAACGMFYGPRNTEIRPSLSYEQVLIVHDAAKRREHFIREVTFRGSRERFGFVVPTPSRPEVGKVETSPFKLLHKKLPFESPEDESLGLGLSGIGQGSGQGFGRGSSGGGVNVITVEKVGSFTAFVLAADDAAALAKWLEENQLTKSAEATPWLEHFVRSKFYFVAMRYDPPKPKPGAPSQGAAASGELKTEVVRISFDTPRPYYPYFEPNRPPRADDPRMLEIWLATQAGPSQPLAVRAREGVVQWLRPFAEGQRYGAEARASVAEAMGGDARLLPAGQLVVQRFIDQKKRRNGWGDVVFVPEERDPLDAATDDALGRLAAVLDPRLLPAETK